MSDVQNVESMGRNTGKYQRGNRNMNMNMDMDNCKDMDMSKNMHKHMDDRFPIGMSYVPWQHWGNLYEPEKALHVGTIFQELNKPYYGKRGKCPW